MRRLRISHANPSKLAKPRGFTQVVEAKHFNRIVYISGQVSVNKKYELVGRGNLEVQTCKAFENLKSALEEVHLGFKNVVRLNIYTTRPRDIDIIRKVRSKFLDPDNPPAMTTVGVTRLVKKGAMIEIEAVAVQ